MEYSPIPEAPPVMTDTSSWDLMCAALQSFTALMEIIL
jgi:hypothetical protein